MSFTGDESSAITLAEGGTMTKAYRDANPTAVKGHFFGKNKINSILNQSGCVGIRVYYGLDSTGAKQLVMVGVDSNQNDQYNSIILDRAVPCPAYCGISNDLNTTAGPPIG